MKDDSQIMKVEFAENPENRCPVILLLDVSSSMSGEPINQLNNGVAIFKEEIEKDPVALVSVEIEIITFGSRVEIIQQFTTLDNFELQELRAGGSTPMGQAINVAIDRLTQRKKEYAENDIAYYRPWLILMTDGEPTDPYEEAARRLKEQQEENRLTSYIIAVGDNANLSVLHELSLNRQVLQLDGLEFGKLFKWLSASVQQVSSSAIGTAIQLRPVDWGKTI